MWWTLLFMWMACSRQTTGADVGTLLWTEKFTESETSFISLFKSLQIIGSPYFCARQNHDTYSRTDFNYILLISGTWQEIIFAPLLQGCLQDHQTLLPKVVSPLQVEISSIHQDLPPARLANLHRGRLGLKGKPCGVSGRFRILLGLFITILMELSGVGEVSEEVRMLPHNIQARKQKRMTGNKVNVFYEKKK